jgi:hypothetical protein
VKPGILRLLTVSALFALPTMIIPCASANTCARVWAGLPSGVSHADELAHCTVWLTFTPAESRVAHWLPPLQWLFDRICIQKSLSAVYTIVKLGVVDKSSATPNAFPKEIGATNHSGALLKATLATVAPASCTSKLP